MTVMKGDRAANLLKDAVVLDLGDIGRQAAKIRAAAESRASQIEEEAKQRAQAMIDDASSKGFEQGNAAGIEQGIKDGLEQGRAQAFEAAAAQLQQLQEAWGQALSDWENHQASMHNDAKQSVLELALRMAEKIVHRAVEVDPSIIVEQVSSALAHVLGAYDVMVHINPQDKPMLQQAVPDLAAEFSHLKHIDLHEDQSIQPGGCVISFGQGQINATLESQLQYMVEMMLPDPAEEVQEEKTASEVQEVVSP